MLSVVDASIVTDQRWFDRLDDPTVGAGILDGRPIMALNDVDAAVDAWSTRIQGLVVWDDNVPATVNATFAVAGTAGLIAVCRDADSNRDHHMDAA